MFGFDEPEQFDYTCPHCGKGYYVDVGMGPILCISCGESMHIHHDYKPVSDEEHEVYSDPRFLNMDTLKAFVILRDLNLLEECVKDED